jgi:hypothetical protein
MEALQMQKFWFKKEHLDFTTGWMMHEKQLVEDDPDEDLLQTLAIHHNNRTGQNNLDTVI